MTNPDNVGGLRYTDHNVMNGALCDFATRWRIDGDYIRCGTCDRPQLTSYADNNFPHADFCRVKDSPNMERRPWQTYVALLSPLCRAAPAGGERVDGEMFICYLIDKCEREIVSEESLHEWLADFLKNPRYHKPDSAVGDDVYGWVLTGPEGSMFCPATHRHVMEASLKVDGCSAVAVFTRPAILECNECKAPGLLFECVACSHSNYPKDAAPAGSGEVEALAMWLVLRAEGGSEGDYVATKLRKAAALLRKLQQGAE